MILLAIDPGPKVSGAVCINTDTREPSWIQSEIENHLLLEKFVMLRHTCDRLAFEMVASFGMPVGKDVFETVLWSGRFIQAFDAHRADKVFRQDVKMTLCGNTRAKDGNIRQAILDRYEPSGGGKTPQIGTKAKPGSLYGVSKHAWSALAVGLTWIEHHA